jgi:7,8-dihydropterin-6-yl-methyl-4-(beta-D-ribofuranosyl)aminobenzene 5'-phosphate synthase
MRIDLKDVQFAVISHGHYDHGGGIDYFLDINKHAPVYIHKNAFELHLALRDGKYTDIGLNPDLKHNSRMIFTDGITEISEEIILFSGTGKEYPVPSGNGNLLAGSMENPHPDDFEHEQNLIIKEDGKAVLIAGCSHRGIANIVAKAKEILGKFPDAVIGGFHLRAKSENSEDMSDVYRISEVLSETGAKFFTGHCTEEPAYKKMKEVLKENIGRMGTGNILEP